MDAGTFSRCGVRKYGLAANLGDPDHGGLYAPTAFCRALQRTPDWPFGQLCGVVATQTMSGMGDFTLHRWFSEE
jgi:hypothetical protein